MDNQEIRWILANGASGAEILQRFLEKHAFSHYPPPRQMEASASVAALVPRHILASAILVRSFEHATAKEVRF
jgi:hypothetical protein